AQIADAICKPERDGLFTRPIFTGEQLIVGALEFRAAAVLHQRDEDRMDLALDRLEPRDVIGVFGEEWIERRLVLACRIEPALHADLPTNTLKTKPPPAHADRTEDRGRIAKDFVTRARNHITAGCRHILDEHQHRQFLLSGKLTDAQVNLP